MSVSRSEFSNLWDFAVELKDQLANEELFSGSLADRIDALEKAVAELKQVVDKLEELIYGKPGCGCGCGGVLRGLQK